MTYSTLTVTATEAEILRPLLEERRANASDHSTPINRHGWAEYIELLDEAGTAELPFPTAVLRDILYDGLVQSLGTDAFRCSSTRPEARRRIKRAQWFLTRLRETRPDVTGWAERLAPVITRLDEIERSISASTPKASA